MVRAMEALHLRPLRRAQSSSIRALSSGRTAAGARTPSRQAKYDSAVARELVIAFPGEEVAARASLLADVAPRTCQAIWAALPVRGQARHAIYSGSEVYLILPELMRLPPENVTTRVLPGDVAFGWFAAGSFYGAVEDYCEVCWFYDRDATPSTPRGPVPVSLFARLEEAEAFSTSATGCASRAPRK
jgi:hypothetical protein